MESPASHKFFDINRFPKQEGLLLFPISMSRIGNAQGAEECFRYMEYFIPKILKPTVGLNIIYSESLYLNSSEKAHMLKQKNEPLAHGHKYAFLRLMEKHPLYVQSSVNFLSWNQLLLEAKDFFNLLGELKKIYTTDIMLQQCVKQDATDTEVFTANKVNFILEESLIFYLVSKGRVRLRNDFVADKQKWILWCYPGKPLHTEIYLYKKNFFKLENPQNIYENSYYDLTGKKLYDYSKIDLSDIENIK